ncbi:MAG: regulatory iron-sulfur-containing complex subunit RicT [Flavobacteriales bacterium]
MAEGCNNCAKENDKNRGCKHRGNCIRGQCDKLEVLDWLANIRPFYSEIFDYVEVRFKNDRKDFYKNSQKLPLQAGDWIAVEAPPGHDICMVTLTGELVRIQMRNKKVLPIAKNAKKIYRKASEKDLIKWRISKDKEPQTISKAKEIIKDLEISMKLCDVEYQGDGGKAIFYYTAENRVDFRKLIKILAQEFNVKIEMRQIGYRQEAAKVGGIGSCGRELCCSTWLTDFRSVNTTAARYQQLSINTQKLTGQCGKLKCCLNYELDTYLEAIKDFPDADSKLYTEKGTAQCMKIDVFKKEMWFAYAKDSPTWYKLSVKEVQEIIMYNQQGKKALPLEQLSMNNELEQLEPVFQDMTGGHTLTRHSSKKKTFPSKNV